ncbi:MAG: hypothetical protein JWM91_1674 [Rhodospirillales bacterium]|nr:hypothetical protein [Rhodospirillales bacterium]
MVAGVASADPGIRITPSIGLNQAYTDNTAGLQKSRSDFVTQISPGLSINGEAAHTQVNFTYQPTFNHFDLGRSPDRVDENLDAVGTITPITNELIVDFQASANEAGATGNSSNQQGIIIPAGNQILYYLATVTPHLTEHYHDIATLDLIYSINSANTSVDGKPALINQGITSTNSLGQDAELAIGSAESFGRLGMRLDFKHSANSGNGANTNSTTDLEVLGGSYHINRVYSLSGSIGYQAIDYPANGESLPYHSEGLTWSIGLNITPNELSTIALGYGKQQGAYNPSIQVGYALGPLTTITASYLVSVQNQLSAALQNTRFLVFDQFGNAIDSRTGLPFSAVNQSFGSQNILFRDKPAVISISHQLLRSSLSLTTQYEVRTSLSGPSMSTEVFGATISYTRELTPVIHGNVRLGYTQSTTSGFGSLTGHTESISVSAGLFYELSDSVTMNVIENYFNNTSGLAANGSKTQQLTIGLRKSF